MATENSLAIKIQNIPGGGQGAMIFNVEPYTNIGYGTELPHLLFSQKLRLVTDKDATYRGPAWQFQAQYDKVVVASPDAFEPTASKLKTRDWLHVAQPGDQPWYCYWNQTLLEGFIYTQENSTAYNTMGNSTNTLSNSANWHGGSLDKRDSSSASTTSSAVSATGTASSAETATSCQTWTSASTGTASGNWCKPNTTDPWARLDLYPLVVMVEERRMPGNTIQPYCVKMQVADDGTSSPLLDNTGAQTVVHLTESGPNLNAYASVYGQPTQEKRSQSSTHAIVNKALVSGACHCQWVSGDISAAPAAASASAIASS